MLIISTSAAVLSLILYLLPFVIGLIKKEDMYMTPKRRKKIPNKWILVGKVIIIIALIVIFIFTFPQKVMFYPFKVLIFVGILFLLELITLFTIFNSELEGKILTLSAISFLGLIAIVVILLVVSNNVETEIVAQPKEHSIQYKIEYSSDDVYYYYQSPHAKDLKELSPLSICHDENVKIKIVDDTEPSYIEKIISIPCHENAFDKDTIVYEDKSESTERYRIYVHESDLTD